MQSTDFDAVSIHFDESGLFIVNLAIAFVMFGVALGLSLSDFQRLFRQPRAALTGIVSQWLMLPALTLGLIILLRPPPSLAMGMVLISVCPGGNVSNFLVQHSKGNAALSVTLTTVATLSSAIATPVLFTFWSAHVPGLDADADVQVSILAMLRVLAIVIVIPLSLGMFIASRFPDWTDRMRVPLGRAGFVVLLAILLIALTKNLSLFLAYIPVIGGIVLIHNGLALLCGYGLARLVGLEERDRRAVSIETGIQNGALGLVLIFQFFDGRGGMALIAAWWGIWHIVSGLALATWWSKRDPLAPSTAKDATPA